jgi:hypothetical protein
VEINNDLTYFIRMVIVLRIQLRLVENHYRHHLGPNRYRFCTTTTSFSIYIIVNVPNFQCSYNSKFLQLNFLKRFLGGGFIKHMQVCFLPIMVFHHLLDFLSIVKLIAHLISFYWLNDSGNFFLYAENRKMNSFMMSLSSNRRKRIF